MATTTTVNDWALHLVDVDMATDNFKFKDAVTTAITEMCRRVGGPVGYLRARFPTSDSKTKFAQWLYAECPPDDSVEYIQARGCVAGGNEGVQSTHQEGLEHGPVLQPPV